MCCTERFEVGESGRAGEAEEEEEDDYEDGGGRRRETRSEVKDTRSRKM